MAIFNSKLLVYQAGSHFSPHDGTISTTRGISLGDATVGRFPCGEAGRTCWLWFGKHPARFLHNWKSIAKSGLIPGGGDSVNSGRAHVYMSEHRIGTDGYRSGLRAKCPVEIKIAMKQAIQGDVIFSRTEMDGILTSKKVPPQYTISIAEDNKVILSRAESNLEKITMEHW